MALGPGWILLSPREALEAQSSEPMPFVTALLAVVAALLSAAMAEVIVAPSPAADQLLVILVSYGVAFACFTVFLHQISRLLSTDVPRLGAWLRAGAIVILPVHLLLPSALLVRPLGIAGLVIYEGAKLTIFTFLVRRSSWAIQTLLRWPPWAGFLMTVSPFLIGMLGLLLAMGLLLVVLMAAALASFA